METLRLTLAQALVRYLAAQRAEVSGREVPLFAGVWAIFGHGNVAGLGDALYEMRDELPTLRAHNEQAMAHAAIAYAKATNRRRMMACTTSIGPGALNLVTAAALAHVNRLPVLLLPGDVFASRAPDPVLQQVEDFEDPTVTANDALRPVSRYWDRITRPEQLLASLPRALDVLTDPACTGPATLCLTQDVQAEAWDWPTSFFEPRVRRLRRPGTDEDELAEVVRLLLRAERPLVIAGGGVHYSDATATLARFAEAHDLPVAETQAGKGALPWTHPQSVGAIGVTGSAAANALAAEADVVLAVGTRLQDFTTGSWALFRDPEVRLACLNVSSFDAAKHRALPLVADARRALEALSVRLAGYRAKASWAARRDAAVRDWNAVVERVTSPGDDLPSDAQVLGVVNRFSDADDVVVCAAGGLPGELHKLWRTERPGGYHVEYGFSCMGYEIAGGLGVRMARETGEVYVLVGDGSYLMLNNEIATSVHLDRKLCVVVLDNHGFGCINRLQLSCGGASFNNLFTTTGAAPAIDFVMNARSLGAEAEKVSGLDELAAALARAKASKTTYVIVIETDPTKSTAEGGAWWEVAVPEVSAREEVRRARDRYEQAKRGQR